MSANTEQVGGAHYRGLEYQHWDWCIDLNLGYLESAATKYISRWRQKNGLEDLKKARHYLTKAGEAYEDGRYRNTSIMVDSARRQTAQTFTVTFLKGYGIVGIEYDLLFQIADWHDTLTIRHCIGLLDLVIHTVEQGKDPAELGYWPGLRQASTAEPYTPQPAQPPGAATLAQLGRSTNQPSGQKHPFGYDEERDA